MTSHVELDRRLTAWLEEEAAPHAPGELHARFIQGMERSRQRPGWATTERWISMETRAQLGAVPRTAIILVILGLLMAVAAGAIVVGSGGDARKANGLLAFAYLGDVYTTQPDGSDRQLLVSEPGTQEAPSWSPDGTRLAYWSATDVRGPSQLMVVTADGSEPVTVASDLLEDPGWGVPIWSPDGSSLAFSARTLPTGQGRCAGTASVLGDFCSSRIFVAAADGSTGAVQIGDPDMDARTAAWSPDGTTIAFSGGDAGTGIALYGMAPDGSDVRRLSDVSGTAWAFLRLDWSPDGASIVATAGEQEWDIWVFAADGSSETNVSDAQEGPEVVDDELFPSYAPDGAIAWASSRGLELLEPDGTPVAFSDLGGVPVWSPDGLLIASSSDETTGLSIIDRTGAVVATIEDIGSVPSWQALPA